MKISGFDGEGEGLKSMKVSAFYLDTNHYTRLYIIYFLISSQQDFDWKEGDVVTFRVKGEKQVFYTQIQALKKI